MTTENPNDVECPWCYDNNRCGHEWHGNDELKRLRSAYYGALGRSAALSDELDAARVNITSLQQTKARVEAERDAAIEHARVTDARLRSIVDLYRSDPMAMADALWRMREQIGALRLAAEDAQR